MPGVGVIVIVGVWVRVRVAVIVCVPVGVQGGLQTVAAGGGGLHDARGKCTRNPGFRKPLLHETNLYRLPVSLCTATVAPLPCRLSAPYTTSNVFCPSYN